MQNLSLTLAAALALTACANTGNSGAPAAPAPAQIAAELCPPLQAAIIALQVDTGLSVTAQADLAAAAPQAARVCAAASQATLGDAAALQSLAFSVVLPIVQEKDPQLAADLLAAQIIITTMEQVQLAAQAGGSAPSTPASAPSAVGHNSP